MIAVVADFPPATRAIEKRSRSRGRRTASRRRRDPALVIARNRVQIERLGGLGRRGSAVNGTERVQRLPSRHRLAAAWVVGALGLGVPQAPGAAAQTAVDLELVLAIDTSGSVDTYEFSLQTRGIAEALRDPEIHAALRAYATRGVAMAAMQWSSRRQQAIAVDWMVVSDAASAVTFADRLERTGRLILGETAIADALSLAVDMLASNAFDGDRQVIDISGDGPTNSGGDPDPVRDAAVALGVTINGLAILNEVWDLDQYYREHVTGGPGAFVIAAKDYGDFGHAMRLKLLREIQGVGLADAGAPARLRREPR